MSNRKTKIDRAVRRKAALGPTEPTTETAAFPSAAPNGDEEVSLARMSDDGGSPPPSNNEDEVSLARMPDDPSPALPSPLMAAVAAPMALSSADTLSLEERVRRLEDALAQLQEHRGGDNRIVARPAEASPAAPKTVPAASSPPASVAGLFDMGKRMLGVAADAVAQAPASLPASAPPSSLRGRSLWLLWDTWAEARAIVRMFVDPRYHLPWSARILPLLLLAAIVTSYYWVPGTTIPLLGSWINKVVDLLLAFLLFKWLSHEARRYRQTSPDLPPNLRL